MVGRLRARPPSVPSRRSTLASTVSTFRSTRSRRVLMAARSSLLRRVCSRTWRVTSFSPSSRLQPCGNCDSPRLALLRNQAHSTASNDQFLPRSGKTSAPILPITDLTIPNKKSRMRSQPVGFLLSMSRISRSISFSIRASCCLQKVRKPSSASLNCSQELILYSNVPYRAPSLNRIGSWKSCSFEYRCFRKNTPSVSSIFSRSSAMRSNISKNLRS